MRTSSTITRVGHYAWECPKKGKEAKALIAEGYASDEPTLL